MLELREYRAILRPVMLDGVGRAAKIASPEEIGRFLAGQGEEPIAIARVPADIVRALGAASNRLMLSRYTADKQRKHPEISASSFGFLQELLNVGERIYDRAHHAAIVQYRESPYVAVIKVTQVGDEVFLQSFRRTDERNVASLRKRGKAG